MRIVALTFFVSSLSFAQPEVDRASDADAVHVGAQFQGAFIGSTAGFGLTSSIGVGWNRFALLFEPTVHATNGDGGLVLGAISLGIQFRIYFADRVVGALVPLIRFTPFFGIQPNTPFGGLTFGGGAEYLLTKHLGLTVELELTARAPAAFDTGALLGVVLHQ